MAHRGVQRLWAFSQNCGVGFRVLSGLVHGVSCYGEVFVDTDFLLDLEFYARMILISILGLCTENCFQFS